MSQVQGRKDKKSTKELFNDIENALNAGNYHFTGHASRRSRERAGVSELQVVRILKSKSKYHEKKKDKLDHQYNSWNYSIRGKSVDKEDIRIVLAFTEDDMLVITVINLNE